MICEDFFKEHTLPLARRMCISFRDKEFEMIEIHKENLSEKFLPSIVKRINNCYHTIFIADI